ncbi:MAG: SCP2 sterol-binding domain-containing protein [Proteobacteria bacterium]|nr:SCP2 sterol-binding domain-containing protein [Pseudomonadota bacterium]
MSAATQTSVLLAMPEATVVVVEIRGNHGGTWTLSHVDEKLSVRSGEHRSPDCRLVCTADDFEALLLGELEAQSAFLLGRIAVEGDVGLALALRDAVAGQTLRAS